MVEESRQSLAGLTCHITLCDMREIIASYQSLNMKLINALDLTSRLQMFKGIEFTDISDHIQ